MRVLILLALAAFPLFAQLSLSTPFNSNNGQAGNMFNVITTNPIVVQSLDVNLDAGTWNIAVYAVTAQTTFVGMDTNASAWTQLANLPAVTGAGLNIATPLNLSLTYSIPAATTVGFYVTAVTGAPINYTTSATGTTPATIAASNADVAITHGYGKTYPFGSTFQPRMWNGTIRYQPGNGLFANFTGTPTSGSLPLTVAFTDSTFTTAPGGVTSWAWDFQNDGIVDATTQNPSFTYTQQGAYSVKLTVTDATHPASVLTRTAYINVGPELLVITTTGVGDLFMSAPDDPPGTTEGFLLLSQSLPNPVGSGLVFGLNIDSLLLSIFQSPAQVCDLFHYLPNPSCFPNVNLVFPPASVNLPGITFDAVLVRVVPPNVLATNVARIAF